MKYLIIAILFILSLGYASYYLYMFDKKNDLSEIVSIEEKDTTQNVEPLDKDIPEYLTEEFWETVTLEQLKEKLTNIKDINKARSDTQETMFVLLIKHGRHPEMIDMLVSAGADYSLKTRDSYLIEEKNKNSFNGEPRATVLHWSVVRTEKSYDFTKTLLKYYKNVDEPDDIFGSSPLIWALYFRVSIEVIKLLLSSGANPNFQSKARSTPLVAASVLNQNAGVSFISPEVIQLLLDYKADITIETLKEKLLTII